jgi:hypothetical protein
MVFRTIHGDAVHNVPQRDPPPVVHAWCNLYQAVLGEVFNDVLNGERSRDLNPRVFRIISNESQEHQVYISRTSVKCSVFAGAGNQSRREQQQRQRLAAPACPLRPGVIAPRRWSYRLKLAPRFRVLKAPRCASLPSSVRLVISDVLPCSRPAAFAAGLLAVGHQPPWGSHYQPSARYLKLRRRPQPRFHFIQ